MHAGGESGQLPREPGWKGDPPPPRLYFWGGFLAWVGVRIPPKHLGPPPRQVGYDLKEEIERKFDKWQEPPPVKQVKPLPAPLDGQRKKRGGRR